MKLTAREAMIALDKFCEDQNYKGYSLYDSHNSSIPFKRFGVTISFLINQVIKRSPINIRSLIGVEKGINPKGYGLFLHIYSMHKKLDINPKSAEKKARTFFSWLKENSSKGYSGKCWGYNYYWPKKDGSDVPAYTPSVVVTGFVARGILEYYEAFNDTEAITLLEEACNFVLNDVHLYKGDDGYCFSYTPVKKDLTINASLLAAEILAYTDFLKSETKYSELVNQVVKFTLEHQNKDGSWYYSHDYISRSPKKQIDFHQGYVIESLYRLQKYYDLNSKKEVEEAIKKGLSYYRNNQFDKDGWAYWRLPSKWPVDIHNQSQGIITFSIFKKYSEEYLPFANRIAEWTIKNMRGKSGNFFYQKWPLLNNKVNYLRWNQAWMLLALTILIGESE